MSLKKYSGIIKLKKDPLQIQKELRKEVHSLIEKADNGFLFDGLLRLSRGIYDYIAEDSVSASKHVKRTLSQMAKSLGHVPEK